MAEALPSWMNKDFFATLLTEDGKTVIVKDFHAKLAIGPGYNFTSTLYRVSVDYIKDDDKNNESVSLIIKVPIISGMLLDLQEKSDIFGKEPKIYAQFLPYIYKMVGQRLGPKGYISPVKDIMVMGDLKEEGFVVCDSLKQLNYEHCKNVMEAIAKFHACSVSFQKENPALIKAVGEELMWVDGTCFDTWMKAGTKLALEVAREINGDPRFIKFLSSRLENYYDGIKKINQPKTRGLNVLNHGDFWARNIMFKYNSLGKVIDVKLVDFQIPKLASPAVDLIHVIWTSGNEDVRTNRINDLYRVYLTNFNKTLKQLGCTEVLTWEELMEDLTSAKDWGLAMICMCLPVITAAPEDALDLANFTDDDYESEQFKKSYRAINYLTILPGILKNYSRLLFEW